MGKSSFNELCTILVDDRNAINFFGSDQISKFDIAREQVKETFKLITDDLIDDYVPESDESDDEQMTD